MTHSIASVSPKLGANDAVVIIQILGFGFESGSIVKIGNTLATGVAVPNANTINCSVPADIIPDFYDLTVEVPSEPDELSTLINGFKVIFPLPVLPFSSETQALVRSRLLQGLEADWDTGVGSWTYDVMSAAGLEISRAYARINDAIRLVFPQYSRAGHLDLLGEMFGLIRDIATKSVGTLIISGVDSTIIAVGTKFSTQVVFGQGVNPVTFEAITEETIVGGTASVSIRALIPGADGNVGSNQITRLVSAVAGVTSMNNTAAMINGSDDEDDTDFRIRLLLFVRNPVAGGNRQDYVTWGLDADEDVLEVGVVPLGRGNGTVDVYIVSKNNSDLGVASSSVLTFASGQPGNNETVVINGKTYTFQDTLTDVNGNVQIGGTLAESILNLAYAINLDPGADVKYALAMTVNADVFATAYDATTLTVTADIKGTAGDAFTVTTTVTGGSWTPSATLDGGVDVDLVPAALLTTVQDFIAPSPVDEGGGEAPIGADVDVLEPTAFDINVNVFIDIETGFVASDVIADVVTALTLFLSTTQIIGEDVTFVDIANVVHDVNGVDNYNNLEVNRDLSADVVVTVSQRANPNVQLVRVTAT